MRISFDFDGTLNEHDKIKNLLISLSATNEIYLITARFDDKPNNDMKYVYNLIKKENVYFTNALNKSEWINKLNIDIHFDNDLFELEMIAQETKCLGLWLYEESHYFNTNY